MPEIRATDIAQFVRHHSCERRLRLSYNDREAARDVPFAERLFNALDPVLQSKGKQNEERWANRLNEEGLTELDTDGDEGGHDGESDHISWSSFHDVLSGVDPEDEVFAREVRIEDEIGAFDVSGRIDFCIIKWTSEGPTLRVVETKASRKNKTNHHIQVATYKLILEQLLSSEPLYLSGGIIGPEDVEYVVGRIDETTNQLEDILELDPLGLESETSDVGELLAEGGTFEQVIDTPIEELDDLDYHLAPKCDQCIFDVHCFPESARRRSLELLGLPPSTVRAIEDSGIRDIDALAELDLESPEAEDIRGNRAVREDIRVLRARAEARRQTLPEGGGAPDEYEVQSLPGNTQSQLPGHEISGDRVIRVYLNVDYDYVEDRVMALSAHVTRSDWEIETNIDWEPPEDENESWTATPDPDIVETPPPEFGGNEDGEDDDDARPTRPLRGESVVRIQPLKWSGNYERDTAAETGFIHDFLNELVDTINEVAPSGNEYVHFYVWSRSEIDNLIEACSRAGTDLLGHLRHLLGCREPLEQLIYSSLRSEVDNRYALGWTGRGLGVTSSLRWYGDRFHWNREVAGEEVELDRIFEQDIFDFKTTLGVNDDSQWAEDREEADSVHTYEIRSRAFDSLPVPYMHVAWRDLPDSDSTDNPRLANQLDRYHRADRRRLKAYLRARTQALRWIDEHIRFHNEDIRKARLNLRELEEFELNVPDAARAAIDFLLLDHYAATTEWFSDNMQPPAQRVPQGETMPLSNATWRPDNMLHADIDLDAYDIDIEEFRLRTAFDDGGFVRVSPTHDDPQEGPRFSFLARWGNTFVIDEIDWDNHTIILDGGMNFDENQFRLTSSSWGNPGEPAYSTTDFEGAPLLMTDSISGFTKNRVYNRLTARRGLHALRWLNPEDPRIPDVEVGLEPEEEHPYRQLLGEVTIGEEDSLLESQMDAILEGLVTRIHLVHGPPGTGKSTTTAIAVLLRVLDHLEEGDTIAVAGNTHRAVNTLLAQIDQFEEEFSEAAERLGYEMPNLRAVKVSSSPGRDDAPAGGIEVIGTSGVIRTLDDRRDEGVLLVGGTVNAMLKLWDVLDNSPTFGEGDFHCDELIVDESSMMVFPHFLALSTLVDEDGRLLLAGDHRQLSPIVAHDWDEEDRPPVELYQPYSSAFEAVQNLSEGDDVGPNAIRLSVLQYSFRLPPVIRALITQLYESRDELPLEGDSADEFELPRADNPLNAIFEQETGLFLITHTERESRLSNPFEAEIIDRLLESDEVRTLEQGSVSILTPHKAQRSHLQQVLSDYVGNVVDVADTVERLQGGEAENIVVSATASDPTAIGENEQFLLDLNRSNVAFSRTERRLIVICSQSFLNHIPPELEDYNSAMLWKSLRSICSEEIGQIEIDGENVRVLAPDPDAPELAEVLRSD